MPRAILMGDPTYFSVRGGANPHTRNLMGIKRQVNAALARNQWHGLAKSLRGHGAEIYVVPPYSSMPGLVYPANAGFLYPLDVRPCTDSSTRVAVLANLIPTRAAEREIYAPVLRSMGFAIREIKARFEGEADFFPAGSYMIFTHGAIERQRFVPRCGFPPWKRIYGFRSQGQAIDELAQIASDRPILSLKLVRETHYHGDTVLCSFGPEREFLMVWLEGLAAESQELLRTSFGPRLIDISAQDAAVYAANSFQLAHRGNLDLFMPERVSDALLRRIEACGVNPILINVSEFLAKGGGSIKCMILDLGNVASLPQTAEATAFRHSRNYSTLFP